MSATVLLILLSLTVLLAVGSIFVLLLIRMFDDRRDLADVRRLRAAQYRIEALDRRRVEDRDRRHSKDHHQDHELR